MTTVIPTRLSVNISRDTEVALREIAGDRGISMTEGLRRLVGYGILVYRANKDGQEVLLQESSERLTRIVLVD